MNRLFGHRFVSAYWEWVAFFLMSLLGFGSSFFCVKIATNELSAITTVTYRAICSSAVLWTLVLIFKLHPPSKLMVLLKISAISLVGGLIPNSIIAYVIQHVPSGISSMIVSVNPVLTALLSAIFLRSSAKNTNLIISSVIGFCGAYIVHYSSNSSVKYYNTELYYNLALFGAACCYSIFSVTVKICLQKHNPIILSAISSSTTAICGLFICLLSGDSSFLAPVSFRAMMAVIWMGVIVSALSQISMYHLVSRWGPTRLSLITYITPIEAVTLGFFLLDEEVSWLSITGGVMILASIYIASKSGK